MKKAIYICFEGSEGTGKTTQARLVAEKLKSQGYSVLETKEPGTPLSDLTMTLRAIALDDKYSNEMTIEAREYVMQAIRSIHIQKVIEENRDKYDFIIQDRGMLSGLCYGLECGNSLENMLAMADITLQKKNLFDLYDQVILFRGDVRSGLNRALSAKKEFETGDAMENKGISFLEKVNNNFDYYSKKLKRCDRVMVENKSIEMVTEELIQLILNKQTVLEKVFNRLKTFFYREFTE